VANEIVARDSSGKSLYAQITNNVGQIYNANTALFETPTATNWTSTKYCISMAESSTTGIYRVSFPSLAAGKYGVAVFERSGGSPATTDTVLGASVMEWDGIAEVCLAELKTTGVTIRQHTDQLTFTNSSEVNARLCHYANGSDPASMTGWSNGSDPVSVPSPIALNQAKLDFVFAHYRNQRTQDGTSEKLFKNDGTTVIATKTKQDNGTTLTVNKAT